MKIRLYLDEDSMDHDLVDELRARGVAVTTALEQGMLGRDDTEQLAYATTQGRVLCSCNVAHFYRLHAEMLAEGKTHAGIVLVQQQRYSLGEQMRRLLILIAAKPAETMQNHVEFLSAWG